VGGEGGGGVEYKERWAVEAVLDTRDRFDVITSRVRYSVESSQEEIKKCDDREGRGGRECGSRLVHSFRGR